MGTGKIELIITTPDGISFDDAVLLFCKRTNYETKIRNKDFDPNDRTSKAFIDNTETPIDFARRKIAEFVQTNIKTQRDIDNVKVIEEAKKQVEEQIKNQPEIIVS